MKKKQTEQTDLYQKGEDIVLDLENEAENANEHGMCSMYRTLYEILLETVTEKDAVKVMQKIKDVGGFIP